MPYENPDYISDTPSYADDNPTYWQSESPPSLTQDGRDARLINLAYDLVEKRIREGTATSQEVTYFLKLASNRTRLERDILEAQVELYKAKTDSIRSDAHRDELYATVIDAIRSYGGLRSE